MSNPKKPTDVGPNRTGAGTSPIDTKRTAQGARERGPDTAGDEGTLAKSRLAFSQSAPPVGTVPPPSTLKGMAKTAISALKGEVPTLLLDQLGERLAFERTGTRLYDALLVKFEASHEHGEVQRSELESIRTDELRHLGILIRAFEKLGADPTAMTPCADVTGVASMGLVQALTDPRTTFTQALDVILIAELADKDGWTMLADLVSSLGHDDMAADFRVCEQEEMRHVSLVRGWLARMLQGQAGIKGAATQPSAPAP